MSASRTGRSRRTSSKPVIVITGGAGNLGRSVGRALADRYEIVALDRVESSIEFPVLKVDLTSADSVAATFVTLLSGVAVIALSIRRGAIDGRYGEWSRLATV